MNNSGTMNTARKDTMPYDTIDLMALVKVLLKNWWAILAAGCIAGVLYYLFTMITVAPTYVSSFTAYVNNSNQTLDTNYMSSADIVASRYLTSTYAEIIVSQPVMDLTVEKSGLDISPEGLGSAISVANLNDTEIIKISVRTESPEVSYRLACALEETAPEYIEKILVGSSMMIIQPSAFPQSSSGPYYSSSLKKGFMIGAGAVAAILLLLELLDTRVKNPEKIEEKYHVVVIGTIHDLNAQTDSNYGYTYQKGKKA